MFRYQRFCRFCCSWKRILFLVVQGAALTSIFMILFWKLNETSEGEKAVDYREYVSLLEQQLLLQRDSNCINDESLINAVPIAKSKLKSRIETLLLLKNKSWKILESDLPIHSLEQQQQQKPHEWRTNSTKVRAKSERTTSIEEFKERQGRVQKVCLAGQHHIPGKVDRVFVDNTSGVLYCLVPKAGCTFWKRIFRVAAQRKNLTQKDVFNISRSSIHASKDAFGVQFNATPHSPDKFPTRLIVTRDPYSRVLSAYLDKFYLPDFWPHEGSWLVSRVKERNESLMDDSADFMRKHYDSLVAIKQFHQVAGNREYNRSTLGEYRCGKFITFTEFIREALNRSDPHWLPIHQICNPCVLGATHVSTMGTFTADARAVLAKMGMEDVLDDMDRTRQVDLELDMTVESNFRRIHEPELGNFFNSCVSDQELAYRLWHSFQWRGYIDPDVEYIIPKENDEEVVKADLLQQTWRARASGLKNPEKMRAAKNGFFRRAFESLSRELFDQITMKYKLDFELFGYENKREEMKALYFINIAQLWS